MSSTTPEEIEALLQAIFLANRAEINAVVATRLLTSENNLIASLDRLIAAYATHSRRTIRSPVRSRNHFPERGQLRLEGAEHGRKIRIPIESVPRSHEPHCRVHQ